MPLAHSPHSRLYVQVARHRPLAGAAKRSLGSSLEIQGKYQRVFELLHDGCGKPADLAFEAHGWQRSQSLNVGY